MVLVHELSTIFLRNLTMEVASHCMFMWNRTTYQRYREPVMFRNCVNFSLFLFALFRNKTLRLKRVVNSAFDRHDDLLLYLNLNARVVRVRGEHGQRREGRRHGPWQSRGQRRPVPRRQGGRQSGRQRIVRRQHRTRVRVREYRSRRAVRENWQRQSRSHMRRHGIWPLCGRRLCGLEGALIRPFGWQHRLLL